MKEHNIQELKEFTWECFWETLCQDWASNLDLSNKSDFLMNSVDMVDKGCYIQWFDSPYYLSIWRLHTIFGQKTIFLSIFFITRQGCRFILPFKIILNRNHPNKARLIWELCNRVPCSSLEALHYLTHGKYDPSLMIHDTQGNNEVELSDLRDLFREVDTIFAKWYVMPFEDQKTIGWQFLYVFLFEYIQKSHREGIDKFKKLYERRFDP